LTPSILDEKLDVRQATEQQQTNVSNHNENNINATTIEPSPILTYKQVCLLITSMM
jgi:hypothetical protein